MKIGEIWKTLDSLFSSALTVLSKFCFILRNPRRVWRVFMRRSREDRNYDTLLAMSDAVNYLDSDLKRALTITTDSNVFTPQMSFIQFFKSTKDLSFVDVDLFKYKFIELYIKNRGSIDTSMKEVEVKDQIFVDKFWDKFSSLMTADEYKANKYYMYQVCSMRDNALLAMRAQKLRRFGRVMLSGSGYY